MRIGVFGGTFSPVHTGHINMAGAFISQFRTDILYVIPANIPPHKETCISASPEDRLAMTEAAFREAGMLGAGVLVSDMEIRRSGKSYTYDTLAELASGGDELYLLCGGDMFVTFESWHRYREIFELCTVVYAERESGGISPEEKAREYGRLYSARTEKLVTEPCGISSTAVRKAIKEGKSIEKLVPSSVAAYIRDKGLYL